MALQIELAHSVEIAQVYLNKFVRKAIKQHCVKLLLDMLGVCDNAAADIRTLSGCDLACVSYLTARPLMG